jgi:hypothetical protein
MATLFEYLKNKHGIALRLYVRPPPDICYFVNHNYYANMEIFFLKASRLILLQ